MIEGSRILAVGPDGRVDIPRGAEVLDLAGHTVTPGLVGLHDHMFYHPAGWAGTVIQHSYSAPRLYLGAGVTTVRTTGSFSPYAELNLNGRIRRGKVPGPRMHITGPYVISPGPNAALDELGMHEVASTADARRVVRYWAEEGAEWIKVYTQISREIFSAVVDEAHKHGMKVTGHLCSISFSEAAELGIDNIEHGLRTNSEYDPRKQPNECPANFVQAAADVNLKGEEVQRTFRTMIDRGVAMTSTAVVNEQLSPNRPVTDDRIREILAPYAWQGEVARRAELNREGIRIEIPSTSFDASVYARLFEKSLLFEYEFVKAGGLMAAGVDPAFAALAGLGDQRNMELFVEAGFTAEEAVEIMTANGARVLGVFDERGTVTPGKLADLVVMEGDLTRNPRALRNTVIVFKDGVGYDAKSLIESVKGVVGVR